jgi:hypothetical protein
MTNALILLAACIIELLGGLPDLDADDYRHTRLRIKSTAYPTDRPQTNREYWDWVRENYLSRTS